jgi:hypothetical protein
MTQFKVRDRRAKRRYFVDNALLRGGWGAEIGPYGIAVYNAVAMHADADAQSGYPSHQLIADLTGMSRPTVVKTVKTLERWKILEVSRRNGRVHTYYLTDQSEWRPVNLVDTPVNLVDTPVNLVDTNKTQETKQKEQDPINGADAPAQPEPIQEPKPKKKATGKNALKAELIDFFVEVTGLPMLPLNTARQRKEAGVKWFSPVLEVAGWCDGDPDEAKAIIGAAVARLREINYTISSPKSIINVARDEYAKRNGGGKTPTPKLSAAGTYGPVACAAGLGDTITAADFTDEELGRCST